MAKKPVNFSEEVTRHNLLALDPATVCGYATWEKWGEWNFKASKKRNDNKTYLDFYTTLKAFIIENDIKGMMVESPTMHRFNAAQFLLRFQGIIVLLGQELDVEVDFINPTSVKKLITNNGKASKEDMILAIKNKYGKTVATDNIADALGVFYFALRRHKL